MQDLQILDLLSVNFFPILQSSLTTYFQHLSGFNAELSITLSEVIKLYQNYIIAEMSVL